MIRFVCAIALFAACVPCYGQAKKKQPAEKYLDAEIGYRFEVVSPFVVAASKYEAEELQKSVDAKDDEGITSMVDDKKAVRIEPGMSLVILDMHAKDFLIPVDYCDCRFIKDGKAIGKYPLRLTLLTNKYLKPVKP